MEIIEFRLPRPTDRMIAGYEFRGGRCFVDTSLNPHAIRNARSVLSRRTRCSEHLATEQQLRAWERKITPSIDPSATN